MSQRVTEVPPYSVPMYEDVEMITRWKGHWVDLDLAVTGTQVDGMAVTGTSPITA